MLNKRNKKQVIKACFFYVFYYLLFRVKLLLHCIYIVRKQHKTWQQQNNTMT